MSGYADAVSKLFTARGRRSRLLSRPRGRRATFQPVRDDSLRAARWAPLG
ncbi:MAG: hypothetical protein J0J05_11245 [Microbacterium sp.]|nr:hypothetical protein [Microbacterium sp.]MBN9154548.1 hypothetical protein [Microbacterium sp.]MBN9181154.1 hypothetical protein [Microbacterium sp.]